MFYLDGTATTKPYPSVIKAMVNAMENHFGNPSSLHMLGRDAEEILKAARECLAKDLNVKPKEIIFTSGGTESNNLAILGSIRHKNQIFVTDKAEHASVTECAKYLESKGVQVFYLDIDEAGHPHLDQFENILKLKPDLVSLMQVNNEIGTCLDIEKITDRLKQISPKTLLHVDGVQAYGKFDLDLSREGIDLYSLSGHKVHGPKGIGALYIKEGVKIQPILFGGGQEKGFRPGTENSYALAGFTEAVRVNRGERKKDFEKVLHCREQLKGSLSDLEGVKFLGSEEFFSPYILSIAFQGIKSEILLHYLEREGIFVSTGSACSKGKISSVIQALKLPKDYMDGVLRISLSPDYDEKDMDFVGQKIKCAVQEIRQIIGGRV